MFKNIGGPELAIVAIIVVVLFGGRKFPELGRGLGQSVKEFRKAVGSKEDKEDKKKED